MDQECLSLMKGAEMRMKTMTLLFRQSFENFPAEAAGDRTKTIATAFGTRLLGRVASWQDNRGQQRHRETRP